MIIIVHQFHSPPILYPLMLLWYVLDGGLEEILNWNWSGISLPPTVAALAVVFPTFVILGGRQNQELDWMESTCPSLPHQQVLKVQ